mgnify:CR=1 FL=1
MPGGRDLEGAKFGVLGSNGHEHVPLLWDRPEEAEALEVIQAVIAADLVDHALGDLLRQLLLDDVLPDDTRHEPSLAGAGPEARHRRQAQPLDQRRERRNRILHDLPTLVQAKGIQQRQRSVLEVNCSTPTLI